MTSHFHRFARYAAGITIAALFAAFAIPNSDNARAADHTMFGGTIQRNMINSTEKLTKFPKAGPDWNDAEAAKTWSAEWLLWKADLGTKAYGGPIVSGGKIFVGTNNQRPRNPERDVERAKDGAIEPIDRGVVMCFDEKSGKFLWQSVHKKLESGRVNDWPEEGVCSTPTVEGDKVYFVSNRCTVVCLDANGFANGNQGFQDELFKDANDADVLWEFDMMKELKVFPHNMSAGCPLIVGDILYVVTGNGVDDGHINLPAPNAPSFIALDKNTGKLLWKSSLPGKNIMHGQWSNPSFAEFGGVRQVIFPAGDGWIYSFIPETGELIWKFDGNPKDSVYELGGAGNRSDYIGCPVIYGDRLYIGLGQDPEHSTGIAHFWCLAPAGKKGDISPTIVIAQKDAEGKAIEKPNPNSAVAWHYGGEETRPHANRDFKFGRTMSTATIVDDILYISELTGIIHCMNAKTGKHYWQIDTKSAIWGSTYYVDGMILLANDQGDLYIFRHDKTPETIDELEGLAGLKDKVEIRNKIKAKRAETIAKYQLAKIELSDGNIRSTPVVANGVLYVMSEKTLYAIKTK